MPATTQRDPGETKAALRSWLGARLVDVRDVSIGSLQTPPANGFSSETILFDASWVGPGGPVRDHRLVARVAPSGHTVFLEPDFVCQCRVLEVLATRSEVPVPGVVGVEEDPAYLGAPFVVMEHVDGLVPTDNPPYAMGGWLAEATPEQQRRLWWSGLEAMAGIHTLDWRRLGLEVVAGARSGRPGLEHQLAYYDDFLRWAGGGSANPVVDATAAWLSDNRPPEEGPLVLLWGDSRIGNMIFDDFRCAAVLDWEMTGLGQPEADLGWWLYFDRQLTEALGLPRPAGFPGREETVERYGQLVGHELAHLDYYEVFAGYRFAVILVRLASLLQESDILPIDSTFATDNLATQLLVRMLDLPDLGHPG